MGQEIWNLLAIIGGLYVGFASIRKAYDLYIRYKHRKARKAAQKSRIKRYRSGFPKPISIAKQYADDIKKAGYA